MDSLWQLVESIPQIVWIAASSGEVVYYNSRWYDYTGEDPEHPHSWGDYVHPNDLAMASENWEDAMKTRQPVEFELRLRNQAGEYQWFLTRATPIAHSATGQWIGTATNIDGQKKAQAALEFLDESSRILSSSLNYEETLRRVATLAVPAMGDWCAVDILNDRGTLERLATAHVDPEKVKWALSLQEKYPVDLDAATGVPQVLRTGRSEFYPDIPEEMLHAAALDDEHLRIIQEIGFTSVMIVPLVARDVVFGAVSLVATEGKRHYTDADLRVAEELGRRAGLAIDNSWLYTKAQLEILEREQTEEELRRAKDLAEANEEQLRLANQAKDRFLAILSHELRTPLTPVVATIEALKAEPLPEYTQPWLALIQRNVELEARLIDDLLDLTKISKGKIQLNSEIVDVHMLIQNVIDIYRDELLQKEISLSVTFKARNAQTKGDPARLQQIFWNIVRNAIKFTPTGGKILIHSENASDNSAIRIEISDTGIGIEPGAMDRIFEPFEQGDSPGAYSGGLGLGLAISKNLAELHHGTLVAISAGPGFGSTFLVELQTVDAVNFGMDELKTAPSDQIAQGHTVLLVDDHVDTSFAVRLLLERQGFHVIIANSAGQAISVAQEQPFDLVISDIGLPDESGLELIPKLKAIRNVPAIALSGFGTDEDIERSHIAGFEEHITKPFNLKVLRQTIDRLLAVK